jgi:hypothetical protein
MYYYLYGLSEGRGFRAGPFNTEAEAYNKGVQFCGSNFEIFPLETKDVAEAGRRIKYLIASRGMPIGNALQKQKVNRPVDEASQAYREIREKEIDGRL